MAFFTTLGLWLGASLPSAYLIGAIATAAATSATISIATAVTTGVVGAVQQQQQADYQAQMAEYNGEMAKQQADYQAKINEVNAETAAQKAKSSQEVARENEKTKREQYARLMSSQEATMAGAGMAMEGTALAILGETASTAEKDALNERRKGEEAWQHHDFNSRSLLNEAEMARSQGAWHEAMGQHRAEYAQLQGNNATLNTAISTTGNVLSTATGAVAGFAGLSLRIPSMGGGTGTGGGESNPLPNNGSSGVGNLGGLGGKGVGINNIIG